MKKLSIILAMIFTLGIFCSVGICAEQNSSEVTIYVGTGDGITNGTGRTPETPCKTINEALSRVAPSVTQCNLVLVGDTTITDMINIKKLNLSITGKGIILPKVGMGNAGSVFFIEKGATLELGSENSDAVFDGKSDDTMRKASGMPQGELIKNAGTLILNDGFAFKNITTSIFNDRYGFYGAYTSKKFPCVSNSGVFNMNGGAFDNCGRNITIENSKTAVFNMNGGKISGANLTGVFNKGEFNIDGGEISDIPTAIENDGKLNVVSGKVSGRIAAIKGKGFYTKSDAAIVEGNIENNSDDADASASPEATVTPAEPSASPETTAEPTITPTPQPTLEPADENDTIPVYVNTDKVKFTDAYPFIDENNRTQLPVRAVADMLGCEVQWDGAKQLVTVTKDNTTIYLTIGSSELIVNGTTTIMDTAARIENSRTYIPGRYIGEALGYTVAWSDGCVIIK